MNWAGQQVTWESIAVPITLREWEGRLYIIGYDRETDPDKPRFRYYRQKGNGFEEIKPQDFPKRIATQNMWLENYEQSRLAMTQGVDLDAKGFHGSFTAQMWAHLLTGDDKYGEYSVDDPAILRRFKEKYDPIPLPTIRKATAESLDEEPEPK